MSAPEPRPPFVLPVRVKGGQLPSDVACEIRDARNRPVTSVYGEGAREMADWIADAINARPLGGAYTPPCGDDCAKCGHRIGVHDGSGFVCHGDQGECPCDGYMKPAAREPGEAVERTHATWDMVDALEEVAKIGGSYPGITKAREAARRALDGWYTATREYTRPTLPPSSPQSEPREQEGR